MKKLLVASLVLLVVISLIILCFRERREKGEEKKQVSQPTVVNINVEKIFFKKTVSEGRAFPEKSVKKTVTRKTESKKTVSKKAASEETISKKIAPEDESFKEKVPGELEKRIYPNSDEKRIKRLLGGIKPIPIIVKKPAGVVVYLGHTHRSDYNSEEVSVSEGYLKAEARISNDYFTVEAKAVCPLGAEVKVSTEH